MDPKLAQQRVNEWAARHGMTPADAYYDMQEQAETHREVWDMGWQAGQDEAEADLTAAPGRGHEKPSDTMSDGFLPPAAVQVVEAAQPQDQPPARDSEPAEPLKEEDLP